MILNGFLKKSFFKIGMLHSRPPRDPPPFMANAILNFHFDFPHPSLIGGLRGGREGNDCLQEEGKATNGAAVAAS